MKSFKQYISEVPIPADLAAALEPEMKHLTREPPVTGNTADLHMYYYQQDALVEKIIKNLITYGKEHFPKEYEKIETKRDKGIYRIVFPMPIKLSQALQGKQITQTELSKFGYRSPTKTIPSVIKIALDINTTGPNSSLRCNHAELKAWEDADKRHHGFSDWLAPVIDSSLTIFPKIKTKLPFFIQMAKCEITEKSLGGGIDGAQKLIHTMEPFIGRMVFEQELAGNYFRTDRYQIKTARDLAHDEDIKKNLTELYDLIQYYNITDLHSGNWGMFQGHPVILDYGNAKVP